MSDQPIRIGFIGAGNIVRQRHLPNLREIEGVTFTAVTNRTPRSSQAVADEWSIGAIESDWRKLIERDDVDAVWIGTWPYLHREITVAALETGRHVFCQARMANDWAESIAMYEAARARDELVTMICPPPHRMPWEPFIRNRIEGGDLGEIREIRVTSINPSNADPNSITWREQVQYSGLQALQVGIWAETLNAWVGDYRKLSATTAIPLPRKTDADGNTHEIRIPQVVSVHGELASGVVISEHHSGLSLHEKANAVTIQGSQATMRVDVMNRISLAPAGEPLEPIDVPDDEQQPWQVEREFIDAVRAARRGESWSVDPDFFAGLRYMRKVQAIADSAAEGCTVDLDQRYPIH